MSTNTMPSHTDFDRLANGVTHEQITKADKAKIINAINNCKDLNCLLDAPALPLNTANGTIIADSFEHYLAATAFYSTGSFVKLSLGDPLDFEWDIKEGVKTELEKFKDRSCFDLGRFLHLAVLEPEKWNDVVVEPKASRASHDGCDTLVQFWEALHLSNGFCLERPSFSKIDEKKNWIDHLKNNSQWECIEEKQFLIIQTLFERWKKYENGIWFDLIAKAHKEVSMYTDNYQGLPMRVRPDGLLFENQIGVNAVVSIKTTSSPSIRQFRTQCATLGYPEKEAAYQDIVSHVTGLDFHNTIMVVFQSVEPFHIGVFMWSQQDIDLGRYKFNDALQEGKKLLQSGIYPGWEELADNESAGLIDLEMPEWVNN